MQLDIKFYLIVSLQIKHNKLILKNDTSKGKNTTEVRILWIHKSNKNGFVQPIFYLVQ